MCAAGRTSGRGLGRVALGAFIRITVGSAYDEAEHQNGKKGLPHVGDKPNQEYLRYIVDIVFTAQGLAIKEGCETVEVRHFVQAMVDDDEVAAALQKSGKISASRGTVETPLERDPTPLQTGGPIYLTGRDPTVSHTSPALARVFSQDLSPLTDRRSVLVYLLDRSVVEAPGEVEQGLATKGLDLTSLKTALIAAD